VHYLHALRLSSFRHRQGRRDEGWRVPQKIAYNSAQSHADCAAHAAPHTHAQSKNTLTAAASLHMDKPGPPVVCCAIFVFG
jgi:hypothetical protein